MGCNLLLICTSQKKLVLTLVEAGYVDMGDCQIIPTHVCLETSADCAIGASVNVKPSTFRMIIF